MIIEFTNSATNETIKKISNYDPLVPQKGDEVWIEKTDGTKAYEVLLVRRKYCDNGHREIKIYLHEIG